MRVLLLVQQFTGTHGFRAHEVMDVRWGKAAVLINAPMD
jgi:hypothetical protein